MSVKEYKRQEKQEDLRYEDEENTIANPVVVKHETETSKALTIT